MNLLRFDTRRGPLSRYTLQVLVPRRLATSQSQSWLVKVRVHAASAFFSCLAVSTECVSWHGHRTNRCHDDSDTQPGHHHRGFQRCIGGNRSAKQRRSQSGPRLYEAQRDYHLPGRKYTVGQIRRCRWRQTPLPALHFSRPSGRQTPPLPKMFKEDLRAT